MSNKLEQFLQDCKCSKLSREVLIEWYEQKQICLQEQRKLEELEEEWTNKQIDIVFEASYLFD